MTLPAADRPELPGPAATVKKIFGWKNGLAGALLLFTGQMFDSRVRRPPLTKSLLHRIVAACIRARSC